MSFWGFEIIEDLHFPHLVGCELKHMLQHITLHIEKISIQITHKFEKIHWISTCMGWNTQTNYRHTEQIWNIPQPFNCIDDNTNSLLSCTVIRFNVQTGWQAPREVGISGCQIF
jgi:hypothetical protein